MKQYIADLCLEERCDPDFIQENKGHGRLETRRIWTSTRLVQYVGFPHVAQIFTIQRERTVIKTGVTTMETAYGITSRPPKRATPEQILDANRGHWSIENRSHYVRDVTFDEDRSQIRTKNGPQVMATLRNFAISLLRLIGYKSIPEGNRDMAAKPHLTLRLVGV